MARLIRNFHWGEKKEPAPLACVFPGQGSQSVGMGEDLYENSPAARKVFAQADDALGFSLSRLCFEGPEEELRKTINAQPAILTVSVACMQAAFEASGGREETRPRFVAGHSLGEYTALVAAEVFSFPDALLLVRERGRLMHEAGEKIPGGMVAVLGLDRKILLKVCRETGTELSNINSPEQITISGPKEALPRAAELALARGARRVVPLEVSGAFHSSLMNSAAEGLGKVITRLPFRDPVVPVVGNVSGKSLHKAKDLKQELLWQLCHCVHWHRSVEHMVDSDVSTFVEVGPGRVLSSLIRSINNDLETVNLSDMSSVKEHGGWKGLIQRLRERLQRR